MQNGRARQFFKIWEEVEQEKRVKMEQEMLHGMPGAGGLLDLWGRSGFYLGRGELGEKTDRLRAVFAEASLVRQSFKGSKSRQTLQSEASLNEL